MALPSITWKNKATVLYNFAKDGFASEKMAHVINKPFIRLPNFRLIFKL